MESVTAHAPLPLAQFRVLDLTRARSGPTAARVFADLGADVIMIESPSPDDGMLGSRTRSDFQNLHRNKRSILLDLKSEADRAALLGLVRGADVLIENFRPDVKLRLGIDFETLHAINPRLVYASISGFGEDGPYANRPGLDQIAQGLGGLMSITGAPGGGPMRVGIAISDIAAGLYCAIAAMAALLERAVTGQGQWVRTSLLQAQIALLDFQAVRWLVEHELPTQEGNHHPSTTPMGMFETADGHVNLAAAGSGLFPRFSRLVGREDWLADPRFNTSEVRHANRELLRAEIGAVLKQHPSGHWIAVCNEAGIPCGPVNDIKAVFEDPQVRHLRVTRTVESPTLGTLELLAQPFSFAGREFGIRSPAPEPGENDVAILGRTRQPGVVDT